MSEIKINFFEILPDFVLKNDRLSICHSDPKRIRRWRISYL